MKKSRPAPNASAGQTEDPWPPNPARGVRALVSSRGRETVACARESPEAGTLQPRARRQSSLRAFAQSVSRRALSAYCVPGPCWLLGLPWEPTRAHAELREERRSPLNPGRGAARHTRGCGPARPGPAEPALREAHGALGRRPLPTSRLQVVEIRIQASFQHLHDFLHRAMLNVIHAFFQIGLKRKKKKAPLQDVPSRAMGRSVTQGAQGAVPWWGHCQPWAPQAVAFCLRNPRTSTELGMWHTRPASPG